MKRHYLDETVPLRGLNVCTVSLLPRLSLLGFIVAEVTVTVMRRDYTVLEKYVTRLLRTLYYENSMEKSAAGIWGRSRPGLVTRIEPARLQSDSLR